ncbi:MAG: PatB family C-S lyase [Clostridia bacterium]|nr:PatB family C-S lyase [Clostridia bacterium]
MKMNFDLAPDRRGTDSVKWDNVAAEFGMTPGDDILPMWVADMDFACAPELMEAVRSAFTPGVLGYRNLSSRFHEAIAGWMQKRHGLTVPADSILPLPGVIPGISAAISAFTQPGDGVIIQPPVYPPFMGVTRNMGRVVLENTLIEHEADGILTYEIDFDGLRALAARPDARLMVLCSPHNPLGRVWSREELTEICRICAENDVYLVSDEIHSDIILGGAQFTPILTAAADCGITSRICQLGSPSKSFNTAGTHVAYTIVPDARERSAISRVFGSMHIPADTFISTEVVTAAYGSAGYYPDELSAYLTENMDFFVDRLRAALPGIRLTRPQATYLLWADFRGCGFPAEKVMRLLCDEARVAPDPGEWFAADRKGCLRINVAMPHHMLEEAADRIIRTLRAATEKENHQ